MAKNTYRTDHRDSIPPAPIKRATKHRTGIDPPAGRLGVYVNGQRRAHVGEHAGVAVVSRLLGGAPAEIGKVRGKTAWVSGGSSHNNAVTRAANAKRMAQLRTDRGSAKR
jgi:hypothetical protein